MGRGFSAAESHAPGEVVRMTASASIGPRLFSRGKRRPRSLSRASPDCFNWAAAFQPRKVDELPDWMRSKEQASIGPRLFSRGKTDGKGLSGVRDGRLQLGRGFSAAESRCFNCLATFFLKLQLGRGFSAAESGGLFAAVHPDGELQLGRGFSAAESVVRDAAAVRAGRASIGPRLFSRGKLHN